ncbi:hypothetical protein BDV06DRAFT_217803 [Aspergillus oleicola]
MQNCGRGIQMAAFCIKLLNQQIKGEKSWQDPDSYLPIISRVLKPMDIIHIWAAAAEQGAWIGDTTNNDLGLIIKDKGFEPTITQIFTTQGEISSNKFKKKLAVAIIQHVNTKTNMHQNIFIKDGIVVFATAYYKGFYASNDIKIIH